jgi:hypothetical protein
MRSDVVVVPTPVLDDRDCFSAVPEPLLIQALVAELYTRVLEVAPDCCIRGTAARLRGCVGHVSDGPSADPASKLNTRAAAPTCRDRAVE